MKKKLFKIRTWFAFKSDGFCDSDVRKYVAHLWISSVFFFVFSSYFCAHCLNLFQFSIQICKFSSSLFNDAHFRTKKFKHNTHITPCTCCKSNQSKEKRNNTKRWPMKVVKHQFRYSWNRYRFRFQSNIELDSGNNFEEK